MDKLKILQLVRGPLNIMTGLFVPEIFRGCADPWNLPWGVSNKRNCEQQGYTDSVWWFCDGDLCNHGEIDGAARYQ